MHFLSDFKLIINLRLQFLLLFLELKENALKVRVEGHLKRQEIISIFKLKLNRFLVKKFCDRHNITVEKGIMQRSVAFFVLNVKIRSFVEKKGETLGLIVQNGDHQCGLLLIVQNFQLGSLFYQFLKDFYVAKGRRVVKCRHLHFIATIYY
jgi:hypothetical protein